MPPDLFKLANYNAYLIRLWQESPQTPWRASTQCVATGQKCYFATLAALFTFLEAETQRNPPSEAAQPGQEEG